MSATVELDDRAFQRALMDYTRLNRRDRATIVNAKAKDLMFRASREMPKAERTEIASLEGNWRLRTWLAKRAGAVTRKDIIEASAKILRGRRSSVGFMKSGFAKAGKQIRAAMETRPGMEVAPLRTGSHRNSQAEVRHAAPGDRPVASYRVVWSSRMANDAGKGWLAQEAMRKSVRIVTADMMKYVRRKHAERARQVGLVVRAIR